MATTFEEFSRNFSTNMVRSVDRALDRNTLTQTGEFIEDQIRRRTRSGFGVSVSEGSTNRLKPLSSQYKRARIFDRRQGRLSGATSPARSNLTRTGLMLNSITHAVDPIDKVVLVDFANQQSADRAEYVSEDRPFFNLSRGDVMEITRRWNDALTAQLANIEFNR